MPEVSFLVAARNAERTILPALESLRWQTVDDWEAIVVDDGSSDRTVALVETLADPRIRVLREFAAKGSGAARNRALAAVESPYVAIQDADDISHPRRLEVLLDLIDPPAGIRVVSGQHASFQKDGNFGVSMRWPTRDDEIRARLLRGEMSVCHPASLIETAALLEVGGYDPSCLRAQDLNLFIRLCAGARFAATTSVVLYYRHPRVVPLRRWLRDDRWRATAVERAGIGAGARRSRAQATALTGYARYALRETVRRALPVPAPHAGALPAENPWRR